MNFEDIFKFFVVAFFILLFLGGGFFGGYKYFEDQFITTAEKNTRQTSKAVEEIIDLKISEKDLNQAPRNSIVAERVASSIKKIDDSSSEIKKSAGALFKKSLPSYIKYGEACQDYLKAFQDFDRKNQELNNLETLAKLEKLNGNDEKAEKYLSEFKNAIKPLKKSIIEYFTQMENLISKEKEVSKLVGNESLLNSQNRALLEKTIKEFKEASKDE